MDATPYLDELEQQQRHAASSGAAAAPTAAIAAAARDLDPDGEEGGLQMLMSEDGIAPRKRSRISMACERCRKRRTKCNGQRPTCSACLSVATPCHWPEIDMRKQRKPGSTAGGVSTSSGPQQQQQPPNQSSVSPRDSNASLSPGHLHSSHPLTSTTSMLVDSNASANHHNTTTNPPFSFNAATSTPFAFPTNPSNNFSAPVPNTLGFSCYPFPSQFSPTPSSTLPQTQQQPQQPQPAQAHHHHQRQAGSQADPMALYYMRPQGKTGIFPGFEAWPLKMKGPKTAESPASTTQRSASTSAGPNGSPPAGALNVSGASPSSTLSMPTPGSFEMGGSGGGTSQAEAAAASSSSSVPGPSRNNNNSVHASMHPEQQDASLLFEPNTNMPRSDFLQPLVKLFFEHMGHAHFPFLSEQDLHNYILGQASPQEVLPGSEPFLLNAICAISARFSDDPRLQSPHGKHQNGAPFWDRAKAYVLPMLAIPCFNNVASLLLMAWFCFGQNADSLLWNFSGMAMRMAVDLGLHKEPLPAHIVDPRIASRDRILFWACLHMEIYLCYGVGRTFNIKMEEVTVAEPSVDDLLRIHGMASPYQTNHMLSPFPDYCRLTRLLARVADKVNDCSHRSKETQPPSRAELAQATFSMTPVDSSRSVNGHAGSNSNASATGSTNETQAPSRSDAPTELMLLEAQMTYTMGSLDSGLRFSAENLKRQVENKTAVMLLHLHLWYHAAIILLHRPPLIHPETSAARMSLSDRMEIVNHSAREIYGIISMVEAVDSSTLWSGAFLNLPLYVGACAFVQDFRIRTGRQVSQNQVQNAQRVGMQDLLANVAATNFKLLKSTLQLISERWHGVNWVRSVLEKRGMSNSKFTLKEMLDECYTFVTPDEMDSYCRLIQKATQAPEPASLTEESLTALFNTLSQPSGIDSFVPDDFAAVYNLAAIFPQQYYNSQRENSGLDLFGSSDLP